MWRRLGMVCIGWVTACGPSTLGKVALNEDLPSLQRAIAAEQKAGRIDRELLIDLARAVAHRELASSKGDSGVARVRDLRACLSSLEQEFKSAAERTDVVGAAATLALLETGRLDAEDMLRRYGGHAEPSWLAVAARATQAAEYAEHRRQFFLNPDLRVRRAALRAAFAGVHPTDEVALFDVARRDPDPLARSLAIQTLGAIGGEEVVNRLKDLWTSANSQTRQVIVGAWAKPKSYAAGGHKKLLWVLETDSELPSLVAARALAVEQGPHRAQAEARLVRALKDGTEEEQLLAVGVLPLEPEVLKELQTFAKGAPPAVDVLLQARFAEKPELKAAAIERLKAHLKSKHERVRLDARATLAHLGVKDAAKSALTQLQAKQEHLRQRAAVDLLTLKDYSAAAPSLGDPVAAVRTQVACTVLSRL